jgi:hypothetical protein
MEANVFGECFLHILEQSSEESVSIGERLALKLRTLE